MMRRLPIPLLIVALGIFVLPPVLLSLGLTMTSATEVVIYALACMALNILVGHTGLVSFGHGAWFGLAAYAAALIQRNLMPDSFFGPTIAGVLLLYQTRMTSADPISVSFSGDLLAMVVIGGMRSFLGPALGALFFILFREFLGIYTENWLFWFGLVFVGFIVISPTGLVGVGERLIAPFRKKTTEDAAMSARRIELLPLPEFLRPKSHIHGPVLAARHIVKSFGGIKAVQGIDISIADRTLHALIGPNGAGKTTAFNLLSGMYPPDEGTVSLMGQPIAGHAPEEIAGAGIGRWFQIPNLIPALSVAENIRLAVQARHPRRFDPVTYALSIDAINAETDATIRYLGLAGIEKAEAGHLSYGGQRLLDMGVALATAPRVLLLDEPLAGLAAAERERIGAIIKRISSDLPVLLVEHDIDRVFQLADHITVMNEGRVLRDGTVEDAGASPKVQEVYIGSGAAEVAARPRETAVRVNALLTASNVDTFYGKSHILNDVNFTLHENEIIALLGRNGAGKSTLLKTLVGIAPASNGSIKLSDNELIGNPSAQNARLGIGYVPQGRGLFAGMSVEENLELGGLKRQTGNGVHWTRERIYEYFPRIRERLDSPADYLSGGEQQMVAVARALSGDVQVLLLDEPFEGLAPTIVEQLFETFDRLRGEIAIIIVDHHLDLALALSDTTVALERGRVIHQGPSKDLRHDLDLRRKVLWL